MTQSGSNTPKRYIPAEIRRRVRQRCRFGCIICGKPIYEYEHMLGWSTVKRHESQEITLLCNEHHGHKTKGLLPAKDVIEADKNPFNTRTERSTPQSLYYSGNFCKVVIGGNTYTSRFRGDGLLSVPLRINDTELISFSLEEDNLLLNLRIFNREGVEMLQIQENALEYSTNLWDVEFIANRLVVRSAHKEVFFKATFNTPNEIVIDRAQLHHSGIDIDISPGGLTINQRGQMSGNSAEDCPGGFYFGSNSPDIKFAYTMIL